MLLHLEKVPLSTEIQDCHQSYDEDLNVSSEDDELYGFLQTPLFSPTTSDPTYCTYPLDSPLTSPTTQRTFSLPQPYIHSTPSSQYPDTNIETENYKVLNQSVTTFSTGQTSDTCTPIK
ncbi:hypothetical protein LOD99_10256 [Oopsacas minuta]|uniref:Uncharacterized protein n=1 Tax=Oopsacas minuta TaxID=111878 RepID=A0AAV7KHZ0_9METZ|nr:hypothetical protein LOD99_10256 [Oopsacas minuta]